MKDENLSYGIFGVPAFLLLVSLISPNAHNFNAGGPGVTFGLILILLVGILSPLLTLVGLILMAINTAKQKSILAPCIATGLAAGAGIWLLILIHMSRGNGT
jgi:hypothetical protein